MTGHDPLAELFDLLDRRQLTVFTGPGIAALAPTSLPDAGQVAAAILRAIGRAQPGLERHTEGLLELSPSPHLILGLLFQGLSEVLLEVFVPFVRQPPNRVHQLLARLVGADRLRSVVTVSRDALLERTMVAQEGMRWGKDFSVFAGEDSYSQYSQENDRPTPYIFKIVGSYERASSLREDLLEVEMPPTSARGQTLGALVQRYRPLFVGCTPADLKGPVVARHVAQSSSPESPFWVTGTGAHQSWREIGACRLAGHDPVVVLEALCRHTGLELPPPAGPSTAQALDLEHVLDEWLDEHNDSIEPHYLLGSLFAYLDADERALDCLAEGAVKADRLGDDLLIAAYQQQIGTLHFKAERLPEAVAAFGRALSEYEGEADLENTIRARNNLATACHRSGDHDEALRLFEKNLGGHSIELEHREFARAQEGVAAIHFERRQWPRSIEGYAKALAAYHEMGDVASICRCQEKIGWAYLESGKMELSISCFSACQKVYEDMGLPGDVARTHVNLARVHLALGARDKAREHAGQATALYTRLGMRNEAAAAERLRAEIA